MTAQEPLLLFYSYSHKDEQFREQLETHLSLLKRSGLIKEWHDRKIIPGQEGDKTIDSNLEKADIVLLLVSPDFIASDYCWDKELSLSLDRHEIQQTYVIPIIVRPSDWRASPFAKLQVLPKDGKPITTWKNTDEAWLNVAHEIRKVVEEVKNRKQKRIQKRSASKNAILSVRDFLHEEIDRLDLLFRSDQPIAGIPTGFTDLDVILSGLQQSDLVVLASRPSMGKTALSLDIAGNVALGAKLPVTIFSMDTPGHVVTRRMAASLARINTHHFRSGLLDDEDWPRLTAAVSLLNDAPIYIDDSSELTAADIANKARKIKHEKGLALIIVDYLQLMSDSENISNTAKTLKLLAKELKIPIILLSQLGRDLEMRIDKRPHLSDLPDGGAVEQYADVVVFLYRDEIYNPDTSDKGTTELIIAKHRNGPVGEIKLTFLADYMRFENHASNDTAF